MKHTTTTLEILAHNKKALQAIHDERGFDFEKPFSSETVDGKFTKNSIKKSIPDFDEDDETLIFIVRKENPWRSSKNLYCVSFFGDSFGRDPLGYGYKYKLEHFWSVGDFEKVRKEETEKIFIVSQKREYLTRRKHRDFDETERFILINKQRASDGKGHSYFRKIDLQPIGSKHYTYHREFNNYNFSPRSENISDYIDKSGFYIAGRREELKRRARVLRAEREKIAVDNADFSAQILDIEIKLKETKLKLIRAVEFCETYAHTCDIQKAFFRFQNAIWKYGLLCKNDFRNITEKQEAVDGVLDGLRLSMQAIDESGIF